jgi:hypothetical protein
LDDDTEALKRKLEALAATVNRFTSEAVQLRVIDVLLCELKGGGQGAAEHVAPKSNKSKSARRNKNNKTGEAKSKAPRAASTSSRGASATIGDLLKSGFFKTPKTIAAIIAYASTHRGLHFKANECSTPLLRLLRDQKLKRAKNKDGQYEYSQA